MTDKHQIQREQSEGPFLSKEELLEYVHWRLCYSPEGEPSRSQLYEEAVRFRPEINELTQEQFWRRYPGRVRTTLRRLARPMDASLQPFLSARYLPIVCEVLSSRAFCRLLDLHWEQWQDSPHLEELSTVIAEKLHDVLVENENPEMRKRAFRLLACRVLDQPADDPQPTEAPSSRSR